VLKPVQSFRFFAFSSGNSEVTKLALLFFISSALEWLNMLFLGSFQKTRCLKMGRRKAFDEGAGYIICEPETLYTDFCKTETFTVFFHYDLFLR